jgi:hypothetical protein
METKQFIVAVSGKRGTGKTTLANMLISGYGFTRKSFAAPLKRRMMEDFSLSYDQVDGNLKEVVDPRYNKSPRQMMTEYGQFFRSIDANFWVKLFLKNLGSTAGPVVVDDMRFLNEAELLHGSGAYMVRLARLDEDNIYKGVMEDSSETALDTYPNFHISVDGQSNRTQEQLAQVAERISNVYYQNMPVRATSTENVINSAGGVGWDDHNFSGFNA